MSENDDVIHRFEAALIEGPREPLDEQFLKLKGWIAERMDQVLGLATLPAPEWLGVFVESDTEAYVALTLEAWHDAEKTLGLDKLLRSERERLLAKWRQRGWVSDVQLDVYDNEEFRGRRIPRSILVQRQPKPRT